MREAVVVVVGAGPAGVLLLERIVANVPELAEGLAVRVEMVDPYPAGGGRVWRADQPELLWMNTLAGDVSMFTDESVRMDGPVREGPSLLEWSPKLGPGAFASRRAQSEYLGWCYRRAVESAPRTMWVGQHPARAIDLTERDGQQLVWLEGRDEPLRADLVVLAQGHLDAEPGGRHRDLAEHAARHGLFYVPPHYAADTDWTGLAGGEDALVRGMGLGFIDDMSLLTEGRGGRYTEGPDGLVYHPSGREPVLHVTSRRGVPYQSKVTSVLRADRPPGPQHLTAEAMGALHTRRGPLSLGGDLEPIIERELAWHYYHELFHGHPGRVRLSWPDFSAHLDDPGVVAAAVPDPADRFDLAALLDPLAGRAFAGPAALQAWMRAHITANVRRHSDSRHSADLALVHGMLTVFGSLALAQARGWLSARTEATELAAWAQQIFSYCASGPPPRRLLELVALSEAGIVRFLGGGSRITGQDDRFEATSATIPGHTVRTRALIEARLPEPTVDRTRDPLLRALHGRGEIQEETIAGHRLGRVAARGHRLLTGAGDVHPRRFALGYGVGGAFVPTGFSRPRANGVAFRNADALARLVLRTLGDGAENVNP